MLARSAAIGTPLHLARKGAFTAPKVSDFRTFSADRLSEEVPGSPQAVALAALNRLDGLDAARLLPGHGQPYAGSPHAAAQQGRQAGLR